MVDRIFGEAGDAIVVEERLYGQEASLLAFIDGQNIYPMEAAQDHKPIGDGDTGPNTGGMGAYSPTPIVDARIMQEVEGQVLVPVVHAMNRAGTPYKGVLYVGLMLTVGGPKVLEFNCRFGDPETQPILARLKSDLFEAMMATAEGSWTVLHWSGTSGRLFAWCWPAAAILTSTPPARKSSASGWPVPCRTRGSSMPARARGEEGGDGWRSGARRDGFRRDYRRCAERAYAAVDKIHFEGMYCRRDIASKACVEARARDESVATQRCSILV